MTTALADRATLAGANGARLAADVVGEGRPVLLLHGGGQTRGSWRRTAKRLAERGYRATSIDLRGHGESDWTGEAGYSLDLFVGDLKAVIAAQASPPALVGASLGGLISLLTLGEAPEPLASALVLVDIALRVNPTGRQAIQGFMSAHPEGFASLEEAADAVSAYLPNRPRPKDVSGLRRNLREGEGGRLYWHWDPALFRSSRGFDGMSERLDRAAARIAVPTLLVRGSRSEIVDVEAVDHFRGIVPQAEVAEVQGAAHMVAGDANTPFAAAMLEFLGRVYPA